VLEPAAALARGLHHHDACRISSSRRDLLGRERAAKELYPRWKRGCGCATPTLRQSHRHRRAGSVASTACIGAPSSSHQEARRPRYVTDLAHTDRMGRPVSVDYRSLTVYDPPLDDMT